MPSKCPLCKKAKEDLDHLLIYCLTVLGMWEVLLSILRFQWVGLFAKRDVVKMVLLCNQEEN